MLKTLSFLGFICFTSISTCQTTVQFGPKIGLDIHHRFLTFSPKNDSFGVNQLITDHRNEREKVVYRPKLGIDFKFAFNSISGSTLVRQYIYSVGLNCGVLFGN
jgi:hypothetical protein